MYWGKHVVDRAQTNAKNSYIVPYMHICVQRVRKENDDDDDDDGDDTHLTDFRGVPKMCLR